MHDRRRTTHWLTICAATVLAFAPRAYARPAPPTDPVPIAIATWFDPPSYPKDAALLRIEGKVGIRLAVDRLGRVTDCAVVANSESPMLDTATCAVARRKGRFQPARDNAGRATSGHYTTNVAWKLPPSGGTPRQTVSNVATLAFPPSKTEAQCSLTANGKLVEVNARNLCAEFGLSPESFENVEATLGRRPRSVSIEFLIVFGNAPPPSTIESRPGEHMLTFARAAFVVGPAGAVSSCRVVEVRGAAGFDFCQHLNTGVYATKPAGDETATGIVIVTYNMPD